MSISIHHLLHRSEGYAARSVPRGLTGNKDCSGALQYWAWVDSRIGDCNPGHRIQESAVARRDDALASAERLLGLGAYAVEGAGGAAAAD